MYVEDYNDIVLTDREFRQWNIETGTAGISDSDRQLSLVIAETVGLRTTTGWQAKLRRNSARYSIYVHLHNSETVEVKLCSCN